MWVARETRLMTGLGYIASSRLCDRERWHLRAEAGGVFKESEAKLGYKVNFRPGQAIKEDSIFKIMNELETKF